MPSLDKIIQVPLDSALLEELDAASKALKRSRSSVIRDACREFLSSFRERKLDELYAEGYRRTPDDPHAGEWQARATAETLPQEDW